MWYVYVLYAQVSGKTYAGYTNDIARRLVEHNVSETKGFRLRYRPWTLIHTEPFNTKSEAMAREKFLKTGTGRDQIKLMVIEFLNNNGAVSAAAEKD